MYFDENKWIKNDSFVHVTLKSALLEITDAKNLYNSISKWFSQETGVDWTKCFQLPRVQSFVEDTFKLTFCFVRKLSLSRAAGKLKCNL